jgi:hypothetical protein
MRLGLKRKFSFSYFRENLFSLFAKKAYKNNKNFRKYFCENENVRENGQRTQETGNIVKYLKM